MSQPETAYPRPFAAVDLAIFALSPEGPRVLLARRDAEPFAGAWALPGGFVRVDEDWTQKKGALREMGYE